MALPSPLRRARLGLARRLAGAPAGVDSPAATLQQVESEELRERITRRIGAAELTRRVPLSTARVALAAGPRMRQGLSWEWEQTDLAPASWAQTLGSGFDLLVVEVVGPGIAGWDGSTTPAELAAAATAHGIPAVAWVTGGDGAATWPDLSGFTSVVELAPAAQPRALGEQRSPDRVRLGEILIRDDDAAGAEVDDVGPGVGRDLGQDLTGRGFVVHEWDLTASAGLPADVGTRLSSCYQVLLDVGHRSEAEAGPLLDALATRTAVATTTTRSGCLPPELQSHVSSVEPHDLRRQATVLVRQPEYRDRATHRALRAVLDGHTWADRARTVLGAAGLEVPAPTPRTVSVVVPTNRPHELTNVLENVARQQRVETELVLVAHGLDVDEADLRARGADLGLEHVSVLHADADQSLGAILNLGLDASSGAYIAKMDDDNFYGEHFLGDLVDAFSHTSAGITGKWAHYVWLRSSGAVVLRFERYEHTYHRLVQGGSIVATRDVALDIRFSDIRRAVDSDFLNRAMAAGVQTYSGDRYNFVSIRGDDRLSHTWKVDDLVFLTGAGRVVTYGDPRELVSV